MKTMLAFMKKEVTEHIRSGRAVILLILFVLIGIMNPAVAKLTPWLFEMMAESFAESGMLVSAMPVTALDAWVQFFKNIPLGLIVFVLLESGVFTAEYRRGTLLLSLTKGLERYKVVLAKTAVPVLVWTAGCWLCAGITCGYSAYFWDNSAVRNLLFSVACWWLFGLWVTSLMILFSTVCDSNTGVLAGTGGVVLASVLLGLFPRIGRYLPTMLTDGNALIRGAAEPGAFYMPMAVAAGMAAVCFAISIPLFDRKQL